MSAARTTAAICLAMGAAFVAPRPARAARKGDVTLPDEVEVAGKKLVLNGMGIRQATVFKVDVYVAGLYLPEKTSDAKVIIDTDAPRKLVMHFVRDVDKDDLVEAYKEGFAKAKKPALQPTVEKFVAALEDVKKGQEIAMTYVPGEGTKLEVKGKAKLTVPGHEFVSALLAIYVGAEPPNESLKRGLLGG